MPCNNIDNPLHILATLCIEDRNNVILIWQNLNVFMQKPDFKVV